MALFCSEGVLVALCLGKCGPPACFLGKSILEALYLGLLVPLVSLIGDDLCSRSSRLLMLLPCLQCMRAAFLLVLQAGKCDHTLQLPRGLASKPGKEALAAEPQEDDSGGRCLSCLSGASATSGLFVKEVLAMCSLLAFEGGMLVKKKLSSASSLLAGGLLLASTSGVLVEELLVAGSLFEQGGASSLLAGGLLLASTSGVLVEEPLAAGSLFKQGGASGLLAGSLLLASMSGVLVEESLAAGSLFLVGASGLFEEERLVLISPQIIDGRLPTKSVSPMKNGPQEWPWWQQSGGMLVFADVALKPFFVAKRSTNVGRGVEAFIVVDQPLGGTWGRLRPF